MCPLWCMAFRDEAVTCWIDSATTSIPVEEYAALERVTGVAGRGDDPTGTNWAIRNAERDYARGRPCKRVLSASDSHTPRGRPRPSLPGHADAEADDPRRDDAGDVVRIRRVRPGARAVVVRRHDAAARLLGVRVRDVEDVHARHETGLADHERAVDTEVHDERVVETALAHRLDQDVDVAQAVAAVG